MGRQHQRVDWPLMECHTTESREPRGVEEAGCKIYSGAPMVSQTTEWRCLHYFGFPKLGRMQGGGEGPLHSKQDGRCVFPAFVQVVHHHLFSCKLFLFFFC